MSFRKRVGTLRARQLVALVTLAVVPWSTGVQPAAAHAEASGYRLLLDFDSGESLASGTQVVDTSGWGNHGVVRTGFGGRLASSGRDDNRHVRFPEPCVDLLCPTALVSVPDDADLDPGTRSFAWGVYLRLQPDETSAGANLLQKGLWGDPGGQWKLQVDGQEGRPSCVVSGYRDGTYHRAEARAGVSVATGTWTGVTCRRTQTHVLVVVNGEVHGAAAMPPVHLDSAAPVTVGAKYSRYQDNDQFHGRLDHVRMRVL